MSENVELIDKLKEYLTKKKKPYLKQVMSDLELEEYQVYGLIEMLKKSGYTYDIIAGNHDLWWVTMKKNKAFFAEHNIKSIEKLNFN